MSSNIYINYDYAILTPLISNLSNDVQYFTSELILCYLRFARKTILTELLLFTWNFFMDMYCVD